MIGVTLLVSRAEADVGWGASRGSSRRSYDKCYFVYQYVIFCGGGGENIYFVEYFALFWYKESMRVRGCDVERVQTLATEKTHPLLLTIDDNLSLSLQVRGSW